MLRLVALILLFSPSRVFAAPVLAFLASPAFFAGTTYAISWGAVIFTAASLVYGQAMQRKQAAAAKKAQKRARDQFNANLRDRTVSGIATERAWTFIYGQARVGSNVVAMFTKGARDEYKYVIAVLAQHECESIDEIYINGKALSSGKYSKTETVSATETVTSTTFTLAHQPNSGTVKVTNGTQSLNYSLSGQSITLASLPAGKTVVTYQYTTITGMARVVAHLGGDSDPADADFMEELGDKWPATAVLRGHAYLAIRLNLNQAEFQDGLPQIEALVKGKKILDVRTGVTAYSDNPALIAYDYLTSEMGGVPVTSIPVSSFIAAANDCDDTVSTGAWSGKRYTFNGTITSDQSRDDVLEKIAQSMAGGIVATTWDIYAGKFSAPVKALYQSDIVGEVAVSPGFAMVDVFNTVKGQFISPDNAYVATDYKPYQNASYLAADGEQLATDIDLPYTNSQQRCTNLARIFTEDNRNGYSISANFSLKAWGLRVGQRVTFTSSFFGHSAKIFRVTDKSFAPDRSVHLGLKEDAESTYDLADEVIVDVTQNTDLPSPYDIDPLVSLSCTSGTSSLLLQADGTIVSRIQAKWPQATTQGVLQNGLIEVEWQRAGFDEWEKITVSGDATTAYLSPVQDGQFYTVRARCVNPYVNVKSDWVYADLHQVVGKTEKPAALQSLSISGKILTWPPGTEIDLAGYQFRFHYGNNSDWGSAVPMHDGLITQSPFEMVTKPAGVVTIMGKAVDTSGNESNDAAVIVTNLGDAEIANVVEVFDFKSGGFAGTLSGCSIDTGNLVADSLDSFYGTDNQSAYGADNESAYAESSYGQMQYVTPETIIASALAGSMMTMQISYQGTDLYIEYRFTGPGSIYGTDSDSAYGDDSEPFYDALSEWIPWPGQIVAANDGYQWRVTIGAGQQRGTISALSITIDAPDIVEYIDDVVISASGTVIPYTSNFTAIKTVTATLQANVSGAETIEIDKTINLAPVAKAYNASHTAVSGATSDFTIKGY